MKIVKYWACLGWWISPCYGPFSLGGRFETYEPLIYLIFQFFFRAAVNRRYWISEYGGHAYVYVYYILRTLYIIFILYKHNWTRYNDIGLCDTWSIASDILWSTTNSSLLTVTLLSSIGLTFVRKDKKYSVPSIALKLSSTVYLSLFRNKMETCERS
jgi:hypothetical protein